MPQDWHALAATVDDACDEAFGEVITFTPWKKNDYAVGVADNTRAAIPAAVGIYVNSAATVKPAPGATQATAANADLMFSIRDVYIGGLRQGDHVTIPAGNFEVAFIEPGDTDRSILHLLRLKGP